MTYCSQITLSEIISQPVLQDYQNKGFAKLGKVVDDLQVAYLRTRLDQIMLGEVDVPYDSMIMQLDSPTGLYEDSGIQSPGWKGSTLEYRKILYIERDKVFSNFIFQSLFSEIYQLFHINEKPFTHYRTMVMNKPAKGGTNLPWHQDRWHIKEREPSFTIYIALDSAFEENGCVQALEGSHKFNLLCDENDIKGLVAQDKIEGIFGKILPTMIELKAGEAYIMNSLCVHSSGRNSSLMPRKAISILC